MVILSESKTAVAPETITWLWFAAGTVLILAEFILPGLVVVFLGVAAVLVGLARWLHLLEGVFTSLTAWFILSLALIIFLRQMIARFVPAETSYQSTDEDLEAQGSLVEVLVPVEEENSEGRIRFQGSSWQATTLKGSIPLGGTARLLYRENLVWFVEQVDPAELQMEPD